MRLAVFSLAAYYSKRLLTSGTSSGGTSVAPGGSREGGEVGGGVARCSH